MGANEADLRAALEQGQFDVWYQPEVEVDGRHVVALEALLRWHHPSGDTWEAGRFVHDAIDSGLIVPIGAWALAHACAQAVVWRDLLDRVPPVLRVNVSAPEIGDPGLLAALDVALASGVDAGYVSLELDEAALLLAAAGEVGAANLAGLRERGIALVVDRFGLGDGGLGPATDLPVSVLKLDHVIALHVLDDDRTRELVTRVVAAARDAGLDVIAQGVEEQAQADVLLELGVTAATGYLFSGAVPAASISELLMVTR
ncbi:MAG: EAL domain-containing protein [Acidimicrobiia bacterium]